jgi:hypothetical protein
VKLKKAGKKPSQRKMDIKTTTISEESLRVVEWEAEWESIRQDMELFPQNDVQKALLYFLEGRIYSRWLIAWNSRIRHDESLGKGRIQYVAVKDDLPLVMKTMREKIFAYWFKLECKFGMIFLFTFSLLTIPPLLLLSLIWGVQYQPLIYLLFISAAMAVYFTPLYDKRWEHYIKCYAVPIIATVYRFINPNSIPLAILSYLWIFTTFYCAFLHTATWAIMDKIKKSFDPFGYAYLLTIKTMK